MLVAAVAELGAVSCGRSSRKPNRGGDGPNKGDEPALGGGPLGGENGLNVGGEGAGDGGANPPGGAGGNIPPPGGCGGVETGGAAISGTVVTCRQCGQLTGTPASVLST